jgi:HD-like signal output (HDOD) protein
MSENEIDDKELAGSKVETEKVEDTEKGGRSLFRTLFPPDRLIWQEARRLAADKNVRVEDLATCASQDPVLVIEFLKVANAMFFSGGRQSITSVKTAIIRLGSDVLVDTLNQLEERPPIEDPKLSRWFEMHRNRCRRTSIIARMLSETLSKTLADDCQAAALFMYLGEMLAVTHFGQEYLDLAEKHTRSSLNYRLSQDLKFDVEKANITYLQRQGIPEGLVFAVDRDSSAKSKDRAVMKPICFAAAELVEAFEANRWEKLAPGKQLPAKSAVRILPLSEQQYLKIYERASEYLYSDKALEERRKDNTNKIGAVATTVEAAAVPNIITTPEPFPETSSLDKEISDLINTVHKAPPPPDKAPPPPLTKTNSRSAPPEPPRKMTAIKEVDESINDATDQFSIKESKDKVRVVRQTTPPPIRKQPPALVSKRGAQVVSNISNMFEQAQTSEELLAQLLAMLVDNGPFEKSALIVVSKTKRNAIVVAARGPMIGTGQKLDIDDPLNPLAQCFSKVQSFGNKESDLSPFGSKSFALAPINADHETPVALYADCGNDKAITFEARRVFRTVVEILNERLPLIPGGIPVELGA